MPPCLARAIAILVSVTVSMAAETRGVCSSIDRENRVFVSTLLGRVEECEGINKTSSNVSAGPRILALALSLFSSLWTAVFDISSPYSTQT